MLSQSYSHGTCCWNQFVSVLLKIFSSIFIRDIGLLHSFPVISLSGFGIRVILASQNIWGSVSYSSIFWKNLWRIVLVLPWMFFRIHHWSHLHLGFFFLRSFLFNLFTCYRSVQISISSSISVIYVFLWSCQFHLDYLICWHILIHSIPIVIPFISVSLVVISSLSFLILVTESSFCFFWSA